MLWGGGGEAAESEPPVEGTTRKRRFRSGCDSRLRLCALWPGAVGAPGGSGMEAGVLTGAYGGGGPGLGCGRTGPGCGFLPPEGSTRAVLCPGRGKIPRFAVHNELGAAAGAATPAALPSPPPRPPPAPSGGGPARGSFPGAPKLSPSRRAQPGRGGGRGCAASPGGIKYSAPRCPARRFRPAPAGRASV